MFCFGTQLVVVGVVFLFGLRRELGQVKSKHAVSCLVLTIITHSGVISKCCSYESRGGGELSWRIW